MSEETMYQIWCSGCSAEPAIEMLEIEWNGEWVSFPVGAECLTRAQNNARIEE
jgi:hypothetical protein